MNPYNKIFNLYYTPIVTMYGRYNEVTEMNDGKVDVSKITATVKKSIVALSL